MPTLKRRMEDIEENVETKSNSLIQSTVIKTIDHVGYMANITNLDLSNKKLSSLDDNVELPPNIVDLRLSHNDLTEVPPKVLELDKLKNLDLSFNIIVFFDDTPGFCHTIERLNLSNNRLEGLPFWVWAEKPEKLGYLNLSNNNNICNSINGYIDQVIQYKNLVKEIDVHNCNLGKYIQLMATFCHAKTVTIGCEEYNYLNVNYLDQFPCAGLEECLEVEKMNLSNTQLYHINSNIDIYQNIVEINLAQNKINSLPNEFCNLKNLQTCWLSCNKLLYLPDDINKLTKLERLYLNDNVLCMLPHTLHELTSLKVLDVYNNNLCEGLDNINNLEELDFAQNYFEEPDDEEYMRKKEKLRVKCISRIDGRKIEEVREDSEHSDDFRDDEDEELYALTEECANQDAPDAQCSSPEDWDSDDHWIPQYYKAVTPPRSPWLIFVKRKMAEGNFCPMDAHPASIADIVQYEKFINPPTVQEIEGQFDDYSDDDS
ncbi:hypothetical protein PYW07_017361 [Mythimna separata]|uniref:Disease resistance R13L4/SHOC-2-like LRR domain-containing protein n=1 Tax=Mythimna separata TaxID=271217 RepID=A0AAD8DXQ3_MYTSE|nr:hypothetical protein PYW07_017361 [Mythimna separata]